MIRTILVTTGISMAMLTLATLAKANGKHQDLGYLVLGTIAGHGKGIALLKERRTGKVKAVQVGKAITHELSLQSVNRKMVQVKYRGKNFTIRVGSSAHFRSQPKTRIARHVEEGGLQRDGGKVTVTASYKDHLIKNDLNKILMQAAAVPAFKNGKLRGFTLWEISPGSIYEKLGFQNGDTVTSINDTDLVGAGQAVKVLMSLKNAKNVALNVQRNGVEQRMEINVQ